MVVLPLPNLRTRRMVEATAGAAAPECQCEHGRMDRERSENGTAATIGQPGPEWKQKGHSPSSHGRESRPEVPPHQEAAQRDLWPQHPQVLGPRRATCTPQVVYRGAPFGTNVGLQRWSNCQKRFLKNDLADCRFHGLHPHPTPHCVINVKLKRGVGPEHWKRNPSRTRTGAERTRPLETRTRTGPERTRALETSR